MPAALRRADSPASASTRACVWPSWCGTQPRRSGPFRAAAWCRTRAARQSHHRRLNSSIAARIVERERRQRSWRASPATSVTVYHQQFDTRRSVGGRASDGSAIGAHVLRRGGLAVFARPNSTYSSCVGSMGRRRGRRTRSDRRGGPVLPPTGPLDWPGLTGPSIYTFEGRMAQMSAISSNLARATGTRGIIVRFVYLLAFPPAAIAVLVRDLSGVVRRRRR